MLPFKEIELPENEYLREFNQQTDLEEFVWHRDEEDRLVQAVHITDWKLQIENELPKELNSEIKIQAGVWHRIIKGSNNLVVKIKKLK